VRRYLDVSFLPTRSAVIGYMNQRDKQGCEEVLRTECMQFTSPGAQDGKVWENVHAMKGTPL
jgi:hypothetical protein